MDSGTRQAAPGFRLSILGTVLSLLGCTAGSTPVPEADSHEFMKRPVTINGHTISVGMQASEVLEAIGPPGEIGKTPDGKAGSWFYGVVEGESVCTIIIFGDGFDRPGTGFYVDFGF
ncbi:MAG: hypothetical protein ACKV0T_00605 [Planctomycetales bacterium]